MWNTGQMQTESGERPEERRPLGSPGLLWLRLVTGDGRL